MKKELCIIAIIITLLFSISGYSTTLPPDETFTSVANYLARSQIIFDGGTIGICGCYANEFNYNGPIIAGLLQAYEITDNIAYKEAAERAANFTILMYGPNFLGDEAYGIAKLGKETGNQVYVDVIRDFYNNLDTYEYIHGYNDTTPEKATFYLSFHAVASLMVDANDAGIWRQSILEYLPQVGDDLSYFPVMTLGIATWALAQTGPMDDTLIDPFLSKGVPYWEDVTLHDLPELLASHQVLTGEHKGAFYVRFDHTSPGIGYYTSGYTEDTIFGLMGPISSNNYRTDYYGEIGLVDSSDEVGLYDHLSTDSNDPNRVWDFDEEIQNAREVLAESVQNANDDNFNNISIGEVFDHIWQGKYTYYFFGGELLETFDNEYVYPSNPAKE